ncbi:MAG: HAMP domain-containing protein [Candidatus Hydrogenedens sp.]|nr:HAMP domain-containing protein [Candidatus Hydrogenedens sp.]
MDSAPPPVQRPGWRGMFGIREKLSLCLASLLIIVVVLGIQNVLQLRALGRSIDAIMQENLERLVAVDSLKNGLERIDSGILAWLLGYEQEGIEAVEKGRRVFHEGFAVCEQLAAGPAGSQRVEEIGAVFKEYDALIGRAIIAPPRPGREDELYLEKLKPLFTQMHTLADSLQQLNQSSMVARHDAAEQRARAARIQTLSALIIALVLAMAAIYFSGRWLLLPILYLTEAAEAVRAGRLDVQVPVTSDDELGRLARTFNDMTQRLNRFDKTQKARLLKNQAATEKILDNLTDAIALAGIDGEVEMASRVAAEVFGLRPKATLAEAAYPWISELADRAEVSEEPVIGEGDTEVVQAFVDGEEHFYFPSAAAILDADDCVTGVLLFFRDITALRMQQELRQDAIATVSHQLKTPLTSILMALQMLAGGRFGDLTDKQRELLATASEESDRLLHMVLSLLDMSRLKSGRVMLECDAMPVSGMMQSFADGLHHDAEAYGVSIDNACPADLPPVWVDAARIEHVFRNLIANAIRHSPENGTVHLGAEAEVQWVRVEVSDEGPGVPEAEKDQIFEQFYRGNGSDTTSGAGLGLYIAKQIAEAHGGRIAVSDAPGGGARFSVWLPRADAAGDLGLREDT